MHSAEITSLCNAVSGSPELLEELDEELLELELLDELLELELLDELLLATRPPPDEDEELLDDELLEEELLLDDELEELELELLEALELLLEEALLELEELEAELVEDEDEATAGFSATDPGTLLVATPDLPPPPQAASSTTTPAKTPRQGFFIVRY